MILSVVVLAILITSLLGAIKIDRSYKNLLNVEKVKIDAKVEEKGKLLINKDLDSEYV